jgi:cytochrome c oxidase subunit 5a
MTCEFYPPENDEAFFPYRLYPPLLCFLLRAPADKPALRRYAAAENAPHAHESESFDAFNERYRTFFASCTDLFELQRGLNNCFAYDLVPTTEVIDAALRAARKCNDYATAVRILEGVKEKVENKGQYKAYLEELSPVIKELGELTFCFEE